MLYYWFIVTLTCFNPVSLQQVELRPEVPWANEETPENYAALHYIRNLNSPALQNELENYENKNSGENLIIIPTFQSELETDDDLAVQNSHHYNLDNNGRIRSQKRRQLDIEEKDDPSIKSWSSDDVNPSINEIIDDPAMIVPEGFAGNETDPKDKRKFSIWGGKRDGIINYPEKTGLEYMWSWKRSSNPREPSMPKRVRFSPWGGKRSGQMIYKPGSKSSKLSTTYPFIKRFNLGLQSSPDSDKQFQILTLSTKLGDKILKDALPFNKLLETVPKYFRPGHTYSDVKVKKDGKKMEKFQSWRGKRLPPIIGPIWAPAHAAIKETILNEFLRIAEEHANRAMTI